MQLQGSRPDSGGLISDARGDGEFLRFQLCPFDSWDGSGMGVCASSGALPECGDGSAHWVEVEGGTGCGLGAYRVPGVGSG